MKYTPKRNTFPRRTSYIIAEYTVKEGRFRDIIKNIGAGGLFVRTSRKVAVGQPITLHFPLFSFDQTLPVTGTVSRIAHLGFAVTFDAVQAACFATEPGYTTTQWLTYANQAGLQLQGLLIGELETGATLDANATPCTEYSAACPVGDCITSPLSDACLSLVNHLRWPDGVYNNPPDGLDREVDMLQFLATHPLQ